MRNVLILLLFFFSCAFLHAQQGIPNVEVHVQDMPFRDFAALLFQQSKVRIYYQEKWTDSIRVTLDRDEIAVDHALAIALQGTPLEISWWNDQIVLMPSEKLVEQLPSFEIKKENADSLELAEKNLTAAEQRYLTGRMADVVQTIVIGRAQANPSGTKSKILGRALDEETGEPVIFATMFISETNSAQIADNNGYFSLLLKPGKYNASFEFLGYEKKRYQLDVLSDGNFTIYMHKAVIQMNELVIHGDRQISMQAKDPGLDKISMKSVKDIPMVMGEKNILSVSALLPGIVTTGEGSAGLNVRGGNSDQNAFYINKIPIYNTSHLFGFFPAFNSDIIKDFSIYKGYIPSMYGGRLSSIFNILTRQGNLKRFTAHGGLSPITGNIVVEGPLKKDTCSFLLSARSSYSDWILRTINDPTIRNSSAKFYDLSGGIQYDNQKTQISAFAYKSQDRFRLSDLNEYEYANAGASLTLTRRFSSTWRAELSLVGSQYDFNTIDKQEISSAYEHAYVLRHYEGRLDFKKVISEKNTLEYGVNAVLYSLDRGTVMPYGVNSLRAQVELGKEKGIESALYVTDFYEINRWLTLNAGLRYTMYTPVGPETVYTYTPGYPREAPYIQDSILYAQGKVIRWYKQPDARVSVNVKTDVNGSLKFAFNQAHQNLFLLNNTVTIAPNVQWKLADYYLKPSASQQVSMGVFRILPKYGLEASVETYYKWTHNTTEFKDGAEFLGSGLTETVVLQGEQKAYGIECFLKRSGQRLEGWLSYTFSRSHVKVDGPEYYDRINDGLRYPANYDVPHVANLVLTYHVSRRVTLSNVTTFQSGKPITYPTSVYYIDGVPTLDYSSRNAYRIPNYFRSDLSLTIEGNLRKHKLLHSSLVLNLYNMTGRANPYSVFFNTAKGKISSYKYSVISVPVFSATWLFKLGNYASE